jgi:hypothetical protein
MSTSSSNPETKQEKVKGKKVVEESKQKGRKREQKETTKK